MEVEVKEFNSIPVMFINGEISLYDVDLITKAVAKIRREGNPANPAARAGEVAIVLSG